MQPTTIDESQFSLSEQVKNDYNILGLIGIGGMGDVFLAEQLHVGRRHVALKILNPACSEDPEMVQRFQNEAASAGRINHPNVVTIYESRVTADGQLYVAMEYVEGKTLTMLLNEEGALPLARVVDLTKQTCAGLAAAHKLGIVHRDIKPDNIMITDDEGEEVVKVLDFGLARISEAISATKRTQAGIIMGTPEYMSPEQAMGKTGDNIDARSDVYSIAMVVYEMLTGRPAFRSDNPFDTIKKVITEMPMPLRYWKHDLQIPDAVEQVLMKALDKDRDNRQQSIGEFARAFTAAAAAKAQRSSAKTSLLGDARNQTVIDGGAAKETVVIAGGKDQSAPTTDTNKTSLLGAKQKSAAPSATEANKTTLLGAREKHPASSAGEANKAKLSEAQNTQSKETATGSEATKQTSMLGAQGKFAKPQDTPPVSNANETIAFGAGSQLPPPPPPASYETVADVSAHLSASETQAYLPNQDPPQSFYNLNEQAQNNPVAQQRSPRKEQMPPGLFIKSTGPSEQPKSEAHAVEQRPPQAPLNYQNMAQPAAYPSESVHPNNQKRLLLIAAIILGVLAVAVPVWFVLHNSNSKDATTTTTKSGTSSGVSLVEYRIKRENPTSELETLNAENLVKPGEGFGFEIKMMSPGALYLFAEQNEKRDGSWRWLNAPRAGEVPSIPVGEWSQIPFGYWLNLSPSTSEDKFMIVYVPRNIDWSPAVIGARNLTMKNGAAELPREVVANLQAYLQREATPLDSTNEMRDKNVRFSLSKEGAVNRPLFAEFSLKLAP